MSDQPCPECDAGKCRNCDGRAWDFINDQPSVCACWQAGHEGDDQ